MKRIRLILKRGDEWTRWYDLEKKDEEKEFNELLHVEGIDKFIYAIEITETMTKEQWQKLSLKSVDKA